MVVEVFEVAAVFVGGFRWLSVVPSFTDTVVVGLQR